MKRIRNLFLITLVVFSLFGCKSEEQKRVELERAANEWKSAADKAEKLEGLLEEYEKAGGK